MAEADATDRATSSTPELLTVVEACGALRISRWTFYRLVHSGQLRSIKIGSRRLVPASSLRSFVQRLVEEGVR